MNARAVYHTGPGRVELRDLPLAEPAEGQVLIETEFTAISAGTESMIFRGGFPEDLSLDDTIPALAEQSWRYPFCYGYALVGRIVRTGALVDESRLGERVFLFHPHQSHACVNADHCMSVPDDVDPVAAAMLPNVESAVNFVMDLAPLLGERILVIGQGVVGLLTTALMSRFPLGDLAAVDTLGGRREWATTLGARRVAASLSLLSAGDSRAPACEDDRQGYDGIVELSGQVEMLDAAIGATRFDGRIVVGSWYGRAAGALHLGGVFHRNRVRLISSQVSTVAPALSGRWNKLRRLALAWSWINQLQPARLVTHVLPVSRCQEAFQMVADPGHSQAIQVILQFQ